jgi:hypothetical protein
VSDPDDDKSRRNPGGKEEHLARRPSLRGLNIPLLRACFGAGTKPPSRPTVRLLRRPPPAFVPRAWPSRLARLPVSRRFSACVCRDAEQRQQQRQRIVAGHHHTTTKCRRESTPPPDRFLVAPMHFARAPLDHDSMRSVLSLRLNVPAQDDLGMAPPAWTGVGVMCLRTGAAEPSSLRLPSAAWTSRETR